MSRYVRARLPVDFTLFLCVTGAIVALLFSAGPSFAATFTVNSTLDAVDASPGNGVCATSGGVCTLRAAVQEANTAAGGPHTISIPAGTYTLSIAGQGENGAATGDLDILVNMTITGAGAGSTIIQAGTDSSNGIDRVFDVSTSGVSANISGLTIRYGRVVGGSGGGIYVNKGIVNLMDVVVSNNFANIGGGIYNEGSTGPLTLTNVTVSGNTSTSDGGGIYDFKGTLTITNATISGNSSARDGGGIFADSTISMNISNSTVSGNSAASAGGGLWMKGNTGVLTNVTISGNSALTGGGIENYKTLTLTNVTMNGNAASSSGGNILNKATGSTNLKNTIVAFAGSGGNCSGTITSQGYNIDSANTCGFTGPGDRVNTGPLLGPLQDNGGPTLTHALLPGSPAIDGGTGVGTPATDQRGVARPIDGDGVGGAAWDIGAYEAAYTAPLNDIIVNGNFGDWCNGTGTEFCIDDEGGPDDFTSPSKLDITRFGVATNLASNLYLLVGFDDTSLSSATACVLFDTPTPVLNGRIDRVVCVTASTSGVNSMQLWGCNDTLTQGCGGASLIKSYTSANWGFSNTVAGPWNTDAFVEMAVPWTDLGFSAGEIVLTGLISYTGGFLESPKDSIFGITSQNYDERIRYNPTTGSGRRENIPPTKSVGGTVYTDAGVTTAGAGKTVRLLVNGSSAGTAVTDGGGSYFITTTAAAGDAILVYVDDDPASKGTTATVFNGATISNLDIYAGHVITRHDNGSSLTNAQMSSAKGGYADADILYSVSGGALTASGTGTKLLLPAGYGFAPGGNVTTPNLESRGTLAGGTGSIDVNGTLTVSAGTFTATSGTTFVSGNLAVAGGIFSHNAGTVVLDGTSQAVSGSIVFQNLTKSVAAADTLTIEAGTTQTINGTVTWNGAAGNLLRLRSATPGTRWNFRVNAGATKAISYVDVQDSDAWSSDASKKPIAPANPVDSGNNVDWFGTYSLPLYLKGDGVPSGSLTETAPTAGTLPNYDPGRDSFPGLLISKGGAGQAEADPTKYQEWVSPMGEVVLNGPISLVFWSAMKDFKTGTRGVVNAFLLDCDSGGGNCSLIAQGTKDLANWSGGSSTWVERTVDFGSLIYTVSTTRKLKLKITVGNLADDDMWFAYDTTAFPSRIAPTSVTYRPDAMIKLSAEADAAYLTDDVYEGTASAQAKSQGVVSGTTAAYRIRFQNDGTGTDSILITGTGGTSGFSIQYLDSTSTDRTAAVTGAGYTIAGLAAGGSTVWTLNVTPTGNPAPVTGGTSYDVFVTATSVSDNTKVDQVKAVTTSTSANLTLLKSADKAAAAPGEEIAYTVNASNGSGLSAADNVVVNEPIPANTGFKIGGATFNAGTSTLSLQSVAYFVTGPGWSYTPASEGCSAPPGYDYCVEQVRWTMTGAMPAGTDFSVGLVVRVK